MFRFLILLSVLTLAGCQQPTTTKEATPVEIAETEIVPEVIPMGDFAHNVYIWLKNPESEEDRRAFLESLYRFLDASVYVQTQHVGAPVTSERDVVDDSFTYSIVLTFANKEAQDNYQEEPVHKKFVQESSHLWEKVLVYDSDNIRKP